MGDYKVSLHVIYKLFVYVLFTINDKFGSNDDNNYVKFKLNKVFYSDTSFST